MSGTEASAPSTSADTATFADSDRRELDAVISELKTGERTWAGISLEERARLLDRVHACVAGVASEWVRVAASVKGLASGSAAVGEEWISGPYPMLTGLGTLAGSMRALARRRSPLAGARFGSAPGGRVSVKALPLNAHDALLMNGFSAEVWMRPGVAAATVRSRAGLGARRPSLTHGVGLVLGAGNITSIAPLDVVYQLFAENRCALLKLNPVLERLEPVYARALAPLIELGVLRIVQGGSEAGGYLAHHPDIAQIHITGSAATHDVIVYGPGDEGRRRREADAPVLDKPITSELGGVSPVVIVPGKWSSSDVAFQAEHVATMRLHNGGYNCIAGQVVVVSSDWEQKDDFLAALVKAMDEAPARPDWYPGSADRCASAQSSYPDAQHVGPSGGRLVVDASADPATMETTEYFAPVLGIVELPGTGRTFLDAAATYANDRLVGTLGANVIAAPADIKAIGSGFDEAIAAFRYGTIAINAWTGIGFLTAAAPWGAFPGHILQDIQSGRGIVHNALLLESPERTVVRGPFRPAPRSVLHGELALFPKPPWFVTARSAAITGERLTRYAAAPSWLRMPAVFAAAFRA